MTTRDHPDLRARRLTARLVQLTEWLHVDPKPSLIPSHFQERIHLILVCDTKTKSFEIFHVFLSVHDSSGRAVAAVTTRDHVHPCARILKARIAKLTEWPQVKSANIMSAEMSADMISVRSHDTSNIFFVKVLPLIFENTTVMLLCLRARATHTTHSSDMTTRIGFVHVHAHMAVLADLSAYIYVTPALARHVKHFLPLIFENTTYRHVILSPRACYTLVGSDMTTRIDFIHVHTQMAARRHIRIHMT